MGVLSKRRKRFSLIFFQSFLPLCNLTKFQHKFYAPCKNNLNKFSKKKPQNGDLITEDNILFKKNFVKKISIKIFFPIKLE